MFNDSTIEPQFEFNSFNFDENDFVVGTNEADYILFADDPAVNIGEASERRETRICKPVMTKEIKDCYIIYDNALKLAEQIELKKDKRYYCIVSGDFIFGDFIEAFITLNNWHVKELTISTLSLSYENIDSLKNLLIGGYVDKLNLIISVYFYSHERHTIIKYAYQELDFENKFQLAVSAFHTKIAIFETHNNGFVCIHGSANLRSSRNFEQICIEENEPLYKFNKDIHDSVINKYFTIKKAVREKELWQVVKRTENILQRSIQAKQ